MNICAKMNPEERRAFIAKIPRQAAKIRQCEHIKANGEFCGSPALRGRHYCYFHLTHIGRRLRAERAHARATARSADARTAPLELPPFEDADSIQIALMQVVDAILHDRLDTKRAGLVLYALQTASSNLASGADFSQTQGATVAGRYEDFEEDFELEDSAPHLKVDENEAIEEDASEHAAELARIEELADAYARVDAAHREAEERLWARKEAGEDVSEDEAKLEKIEPRNAGFDCQLIDRFFCQIMGPIAQIKQQGTAAHAPRSHERDAGSQRIGRMTVYEEAREEAA
jgi:hypothetical protein